MSKPIFQGWLAFSGRRNRKSYFLLNIVIIAILIPILVVAMTMSYQSIESNSLSSAKPLMPMLIAYIAAALLLIPMTLAGAQRCRDFGWTGWAILIQFIPYIGWIFPFVMLFVPGTQGRNRYGPDPLDHGDTHFESKHNQPSDAFRPVSPDCPEVPPFNGRRDLENDAYKLFLIRTYNPKKIEALDKFECDERIFDSVEAAIEHADERYRSAQSEQEASQPADIGVSQDYKAVSDDLKGNDQKRKIGGLATARSGRIVAAIVAFCVAIGGYQYMLYLDVQPLLLALKSDTRGAHRIRELQQHGLIDKSPQIRVDYDDYYLARKEIVFLGHRVVALRHDHFVEWIGCCSDPSLSVLFELSSSDEKLASFAKENDCEYEAGDGKFAVDFVQPVLNELPAGRFFEGKYGRVTCNYE